MTDLPDVPSILELQRHTAAIYSFIRAARGTASAQTAQHRRALPSIDELDEQRQAMIAVINTAQDLP